MPDTERKRRLEQVTEWLLWLAATLCLGTICAAAAMRLHAQHESYSLGNQSEPQSRGSVSSVPHAGDVIGRLEIPAIGLSVPMTAGIEISSLLKGVGHIDGTAVPGGLGTLGLAGHRDTYFRPLRNIKTGMDVRVTDREGTFHYAVDSTEIVMPEQVDVLAIRERPEMTLITCYPFDYVGAAPKRFIVRAHLLSAEADSKLR